MGLTIRIYDAIGVVAIVTGSVRAKGVYNVYTQDLEGQPGDWRHHSVLNGPEALEDFIDDAFRLGMELVIDEEGETSQPAKPEARH